MSQEASPPIAEVAVIVPVPDDALARIAAVDRRVRVADARGWFDDEMRQTWPAWTGHRYLGAPAAAGAASARPREERDRCLATAEIVLGGFPFPLDLRARAPRLRWFHQLPAGASNLLPGDVWGSDVVVTTSRGHGNVRPMAEYALAGLLHFARGLHRAARDQARHRLDHRPYRPLLLEGKTVCVVGAGGIGQEVGKLCARAGMRVIGTRRRAAEVGLPEGFSRLEPAGHLHALLAESDAVVVCCQTPSPISARPISSSSIPSAAENMTAPETARLATGQSGHGAARNGQARRQLAAAQWRTSGNTLP